MQCPHCGRTFRRANARTVDIDMSAMSRRYRMGASVRECAREAGVSYSTARNRLIEAGVAMRSKRGARHGVR